MRLQALQMRLYLKTTRADNLERALSQHVAAVALTPAPAALVAPIWSDAKSSALSQVGLTAMEAEGGGDDGGTNPASQHREASKPRALAQAVAASTRGATRDND